jgi:xanthine/CO dehydrogenase XdhC/CoxF family maturation factor
MKDLRDILTRAQQLENDKRSYAIATVVGTHGSTYRGLGARMLIEKDNNTGSISGGCLEEDLQHFAQKSMKNGTPQIIDYDYTDDDDYLFGTGMGCSGQLQILITPMPSKNGQYFINTLKNVIEKGRQTILITIVGHKECSNFSTGDTFIYSTDNTKNFPKGIDSSIRDFLQHNPSKNDTSTRSLRKDFGGLETLFEIFSPPLTLTVFGAGDDSKPLISSGIGLGWELQLVDHRPALADESRFPNVGKIYHAPSGQWPQKLKLPPYSAAVVMSHNYLQDHAILEKLLTLPLAYVGVIGSHARNKKLFKELEGKGITPSNPKNLYSPAGLDLGGDCPHALALSVSAEIHKVVHNATAVPISLGQGPIHNRHLYSD